MSASTVDSALQLVEGGLAANIGTLMETLRNGGAVSRWHAERIQPQEVSAHSHGVAVLLCFICTPNIHLLKAALFHDLAERLVGDMPAPIKWDYPHIGQFLDELSEKVDKDLGIYVILSPNEKALLKIADYLEAAFYTLEQRRAGNQHADAIFNRLSWYFANRANLPEYPKALALWQWLEDEYKAASQ